MAASIQQTTCTHRHPPPRGPQHEMPLWSACTHQSTQLQGPQHRTSKWFACTHRGTQLRGPQHCRESHQNVSSKPCNLTMLPHKQPHLCSTIATNWHTIGPSSPSRAPTSIVAYLLAHITPHRLLS